MIQATTYSRACRAPAECRSVFVGNQCEPCTCPNAAIRSDQWAVYAADREAAIAACDSPPTAPCNKACERKVTTCPLFDTTGDTAGTCTLN